jgi:drug/metabolite transporter (DMT)-like permease
LSELPSTAADRAGFAIGAVTLAVFLFAIVDAIAKVLAPSYGAFQIVFFRQLFGLLPILALVWHAGGFGVLATRRPGPQALRAGLQLVSSAAFFAGLKSLPLAEAVAVGFTAPLFVAALSGPLLGEPAGPRRWAGIAAGFLGALVMIRPGSAAFEPGALLVVLSALAWALTMLLTRRLARTESNLSMLTYSTAGACLGSLPLALADWAAPSGPDVGLFVALGVFGGAGAFLVILAHRHAEAVVLAPFQYTALLWGAMFGWLLWRETLDPMSWLGACIIAAASVYVSHREALAAGRRR